MITDESIEKALDYIRDNSDKIGTLRGRKAGLDHRIKVLRSQAFLAAEGTVAEREAIGWTDEDTLFAIEAYEDTVTELETLATLFKSAELRVETWRTQQANLRRGNI